MSDDLLMITTMAAAEQCAEALGTQLDCRVAIVGTRREAVTILECAEFSVVVVDEAMVERDRAWADRVWELTGSAIPLQINFAIVGYERLMRESKAAMVRHGRERALARHAATSEIEDELKTSVTGLLLESEMMLEEPGLPPSLKPKLQHIALLAGTLRERLRRSTQEANRI